jgi:ribosome-binding factor A
MAAQIAQLAAEFLGREANGPVAGGSLITVTRADIAPDFSRATMYISVLPESEEERAITFVQRKREDFRAFVKKRARLKTLPQFTFVIDEGEKRRQRLDELSQG